MLTIFSVVGYLCGAGGDVAACWYGSMAEECQGESRSLLGMQTWSRETLQPLWNFQACEEPGGGMLPVFSPWRLNSNLRTSFCFAYLHLTHSDYPSLAGNVTTLHLSMVHLSSMQCLNALWFVLVFRHSEENGNGHAVGCLIARWDIIEQSGQKM